MSPRSCPQRAGSPSQCPPVVVSAMAADQHLATVTAPAATAVSIDRADDRVIGDSQDSSSTSRNSGTTTTSFTNCNGAEERTKKTVRWSTITVHEFGVGLGGSAVSTKGGPPIGLAATPEFTWTTKVGEMAECSEGVHRFSPSQRIRLLQAAGIPDGIITRHAREANIILGSRRQSRATWEDDNDSDESEEEEEECMEPSRKRRADQVTLDRPCSNYLRRPRMIPANYV